MIRPSAFTQEQQDTDVRAAYDAWKKDYVKEAGKDAATGKTLYRIAMGKTAPKVEVTVSEGQGYGMVIAALMAGHDPEARGLFDGLFLFAKGHPDKRTPGLMQWRVPLESPDGGGGTSAFDGDADIAQGLILAHAQWGKGGAIAYLEEAKRVIAAQLKGCIGPQSRLPLLGNWVASDGKKSNQSTPRSSDFLPSHFRVWAKVSGDPVWNTVAENCSAVVDALQKNHSPDTGLLPDFIINADPPSAAKPAGPKFLEGEHDGAYFYNAGRDPWRLALDGLLNGNARSTAQARKMAVWLRRSTGGDSGKIKAGYKLDGTPLPGSDYFSSFFSSPFGVAAMLDPEGQAMLDSIYGKARSTRQSYYEDTVNLLCLLAMSGNYWDSPAE
ncbi:glycosyl hydrolase family 8 [Luteolibacter sp. LG18]|uniref:glycosyl hydrolase family 8 n=1 Tax=Luteolibacter sp. LG18 TaxID=2819286 RepID=UPI0030C76D45